MPLTLNHSIAHRRLGYVVCAAGLGTAVFGWIHTYDALTVAASNAGTYMMSAGALLSFCGLVLARARTQIER